MKINPSSLGTVGELAKMLASISTIELITPTNLAVEHRAWIKRAEYGTISNPYFVYNDAKLRACANKKKRLRKLGDQVLAAQEAETPVDEAILHILRRRIDSALLTCDIAQAMLEGNNTAIRELCTQKYGRPAPEDMSQAYAMIDEHVRPASRSEAMFTDEERAALRDIQISIEGLETLFNFARIYYGFEDWHCELRRDVHYVDVRTRASSPKHRKRIDLPVHKHFNGLRALEQVAHEVEYHIRSIENSQQLFADLLGKDSPLLPLIGALAKSDDESLYEGVAKNSDVRIGGEQSAPNPCYIIAIDWALRNLTFADVASGIIDMLSANNVTDPKQTHHEILEKAWLITYRVFRGMQCSLSGENLNGYAFTKDYAYLAGFNKVQTMDPMLRDFASLNEADIVDLQNAGADLVPRYPYRRVAREIWDRKTAGNDVIGIFRT